MAELANSSSEEVIVITSASRGLGFMTIVPATERGGLLVLCAREGKELRYTERLRPMTRSVNLPT